MLQDTLLAYEALFWKFITEPQVLVALAVAIPAAIAFQYFTITKQNNPRRPHQQYPSNQTIMSPPTEDLPPPKSDPFTLEQLKRFDGTDESLPIYVSIKGTVFDVTRKRDVYGPPTGSYRVFAGKDASRAFGLSSLKVEDADPDWSTLQEKELKTLEEWWSFFKKRYAVVGRVVDMPESVQRFVWPPAEVIDDN
ncbi:hypothetical protein FRC04_008552 [Tulasnella sp. 424]|nr:hypothetical protein FRC04_008552 [Tulasnella sp. 424]KAG8974022.1 hypothetical protein FRC05_007938 [Tulasnella sp. 425]